MRSGWILVGLIATGGVAVAAPVATAELDVDADGKADPVALATDGTLTIGGKTPGTVKLATAVTSARLALAAPNGRALVVVELAGKQREGVIVGATGGRWTQLARFPIGGVGLDADYSVALDVRPAGVIRYQQRAGIRRCDGKPAYLFPEVFDPDARRFGRLVPPPDVDASAPMLAAKVDPVPTTPPLLYQARAASHQPGQLDAGGLGLPRELDDGKLDTAWREELGSDGRGQFFTFEPRAPGMKAQQLRILNGNHASASALKTQNRVRELAIVTATHAWRVELPDATAVGTAHVVDLPQGASGCVTVVIESTYGPRTGQTAITALEIFAEGERAAGGGDAMLARMLAEGQVDTTNVAATLGRRGPAGVLAIEVELGKTTEAGARRRLIGALVKIQDPSAMVTLAKAARAGWVHDRDLLDVIGALAQGKQVQALAELARKELALDYRIAAASGIAVAAPGGFDALVELAGTGPRALRAVVIEQLAGGAPAALIAAANGAADPAMAGDLWRALTRHARGDAASRPQAVAAMQAALATATDYERRYRLIDGIAAHGDTPALQALDVRLRALPPGAPSSALRQVAVRGLASAPRPEAVSIVLALARDPDPGVRLATLAALDTAEATSAGAWHAAGGAAEIDRVIVSALGSDGWPEVRLRAADALGTRCQRTGPATALLAAVDRDRAIDVRRHSLTSLVSCKAAGVRDLLPVIWNNTKAPIAMRKHAIDLSVMLEDVELGKQLVGRFTRWRGEAVGSEGARELAIASAAAIGRLRPPLAAGALLDALGDSAFPEIVSAAALALGWLGKACPPEAKAALETLARSDEQSAASAKIGAAMCGR